MLTIALCKCRLTPSKNWANVGQDNYKTCYCVCSFLFLFESLVVMCESRQMMMCLLSVSNQECCIMFFLSRWAAALHWVGCDIRTSICRCQRETCRHSATSKCRWLQELRYLSQPDWSASPSDTAWHRRRSAFLLCSKSLSETCTDLVWGIVIFYKSVAKNSEVVSWS